MKFRFRRTANQPVPCSHCGQFYLRTDLQFVQHTQRLSSGQWSTVSLLCKRCAYAHYALMVRNLQASAPWD